MTPEELRDWQEKHTFYCPGLSARITPDQCDENRRASKGNWGARGGDKRPCLACEICESYEELKKTVKTPMKEEKKMAKRGTCVHCKRGPYSIQGFGLCGACYKYFQSGDLTRNTDGIFEWEIEPPAYFLEAMANEKEPATAVEFLRQEAEKEKVKPQKEKQEKALEAKPKKEKPIKPASKSLEVVERQDSWPSFVKDSAPEVVTTGGFTLKRATRKRNNLPDPCLSVRISKDNHGEICLNAAALEQFGLGGTKFANIYTDADNKVLGLYPLKDATDAASVKARKTDKRNLVYSATTILRELGVEAGKYRVKASEDMAGLLVVDFKEKAA